MIVCLTHDADSVWRASLHVLRRRDRFTSLDILRHMLGIDNLYNNIPLIMDLEEKHGVRSTWFFPAFLFPLEQIEDELRDLVKGSWEVGLHAVAEAVQGRGLLRMQVEYFREFLGLAPEGVRFHGLVYRTDLLGQLASMGFVYDSSARVEEVGFEHFQVMPGIVELPLYLMDADVFGKLKLSEGKAWKYITWKLERAEKLGTEFVVVLFHQESFRMRGGRLYSRLVEWVLERGWEALTCLEAVKRLSRENEGRAQ